MYWLWGLRLSVLILGWDVGLLVYGLVPAATPASEWLMHGTAISALGVVCMLRPIVGAYEGRVLWRLRPGWWPWCAVGAVLVLLVTKVTSTSSFAELADTSEERGLAAFSVFLVALSIPVYLACHRADHGVRSRGPVSLPRAVRRARERAARRRRTQNAPRNTGGRVGRGEP
ncbi:hypothetical protein [Micromonospora sp. BQ11]|uniref:hypothetical protein n=1 Tax=Micromonospora sp. BQ11 TaxID=3452212 RepID=UPI003F8898CA